MPDLLIGNSVNRETIVTVHGRHVFACHDDYSLWVEIVGPKGAKAWEMTPELARDLALGLMMAASKAENHR